MEIYEKGICAQKIPKEKGQK